MAAGFFGDVKLWVSSLSMKDVFYVLERAIDSRALQQSFVKLAEVVSFVSVGEEEILRAAHLEWDDFEDCLIALCAEKAKADHIVTRDLWGFERSSVPVMHPDAWLEMMRESHGLDYGVLAK